MLVGLFALSTYTRAISFANLEPDEGSACLDKVSDVCAADEKISVIRVSEIADFAGTEG